MPGAHNTKNITVMPQFASYFQLAGILKLSGEPAAVATGVMITPRYETQPPRWREGPMGDGTRLQTGRKTNRQTGEYI